MRIWGGSKRDEALSELLAGMGELPASARILPQLQGILRDEFSSGGDLIDLLRTDAMLTARIIEVANRPFYRRGAPSDTLTEAVERMGFEGVCRAVSTLVVRSVFDQTMPLYGQPDGGLIEESMAVGIMASSINQGIKLTGSGDQLYTAGLLHGVGKLALDRNAQVRGIKGSLGGLEGPALLKRERALFGLTHPEVSAALLEQWNFSPLMSAMVRFHWDPSAAGEATPHAALLQISVRSLPFLRDRTLDPEALASLDAFHYLDYPMERIPELIGLARDMYDLLRGMY